MLKIYCALSAECTPERVHSTEVPNAALASCVGRLLHQGVRAMQKEFIQHGSLQDLENFYYICHGIAQHKPDMPAHVKDDIDKVR